MKECTFKPKLTIKTPKNNIQKPFFSVAVSNKNQKFED